MIKSFVAQMARLFGDVRFASFISVISSAGLTGCDGSIVNQFQKMLSVAGNDSQFLAMLTESIKLIGESSLELLAGDVGKLSFSNKGLGFGTD